MRYKIAGVSAVVAGAFTLGYRWGYDDGREAGYKAWCTVSGVIPELIKLFDKPMGTPDLLRNEGEDGEGRPMAEVLTLKFTRAQCVFMKNQIQNARDMWKETRTCDDMVVKCRDLCDAIGKVIEGTKT